MAKELKKFDFIVGNPPYQSQQDKTSDDAVYNLFMESSYNIANKVELITPARFLFNAGKTPKDWNKKMLQDNHFKVLKCEMNSNVIFANTDIKGGVAIHYRDIDKDFGAIETFTIYPELNNIKKKIQNTRPVPLHKIMYQQNRFDLEKLYNLHPEVKQFISSDGTEQRIISGYFSQMNNIVFFEEKQENSIQILGIVNGNKRVFRYINKDLVKDNGILNNFKVLVPFANGSGALGEVLSTPLIGTPLIGYTKSFIGIGNFNTREEAEACLKYVKTKFCRAALGILKITQGNAPKTWEYVPIQDFTDKSDIDWSKSIKEIDQQLYKKYNLSEEEINFIEEKEKEMN